MLLLLVSGRVVVSLRGEVEVKTLKADKMINRGSMMVGLPTTSCPCLC